MLASIPLRPPMPHVGNWDWNYWAVHVGYVLFGSACLVCLTVLMITVIVVMARSNDIKLGHRLGPLPSGQDNQPGGQS